MCNNSTSSSLLCVLIVCAIFRRRVRPAWSCAKFSDMLICMIRHRCLSGCAQWYNRRVMPNKKLNSSSLRLRHSLVFWRRVQMIAMLGSYSSWFYQEIGARLTVVISCKRCGRCWTDLLIMTRLSICWKSLISCYRRSSQTWSPAS